MILPTPFPPYYNIFDDRLYIYDSINIEMYTKSISINGEIHMYC